MDELTFEKIEEYLLGNLSPAGREQFEADMREDEELREEVAFQQQLMTSVETESVRQLLEDIHHDNFGKDYADEEATVVPMQSSRRFLYMAVAASLALLIVAGWWFFSQQTSTPESLYTAYFVPATGLPTTLGYSQNTAFAEGMVSYKMEEYAEAVAWWQPLLKSDPANDTLNFYLGVASLADGQSGAAMGYLNQLSEANNSVYNTDARWYLALAYLLEGELDRAKPILTQLSQEEGTYRKPSSELLEDLL